MTGVRVAIRLVYVTFFTGIMFVFWSLGHLLVCAFPKPRTMWRNGWRSWWSRIMLWGIGVRVQVNGVPPRPPFILVSNHLGYLDVVVMGLLLPARFVAKSEVASWPVMGVLARSMDTVFINRTRHRDIQRVNQIIETILEQGDALVFYPEGTSSNGEKVLRFRAPLLDYPASRDYPVHYAALQYQVAKEYGPASQKVCWWDETPFFAHMLKLLGIPRIHATVTFGNAPVSEADRKKLATQLQEKVEALFEASL